MKQLTLAVGFKRYARRRGGPRFLPSGAGCAVVGACALIEPFYRSRAMAARRSGSSRCCASISCSNGLYLSGPGVEEALYDSSAMRRVVGIDLGCEPVLFDEVQRHLAAKGLKVATGTILDATIISAPSSTKMPTRHAIPRCIRRRRATSGISG
jgi:IS5 family transposase